MDFTEGPHLLPVSPCPCDTHHSRGRVLVQHWKAVAAVLRPQVVLGTGEEGKEGISGGDLNASVKHSV